MVQILSTNTFTTAKWIVSATASDGTHTTIAAALTSASSGDTIFIRPGTYSESITLKTGVNLTAFGSDSSLNATGDVIISGTCTMTTAGSVTISGIQLQTNSAALLAVTGTLASVVNLNNCYLNMTNNTGITYSSSSATSAINIFKCTGNFGTTGIALYTNTSAGTLTVSQTQITNTGASVAASTTSAGSVQFYLSNLTHSYSTSSTGAMAFTNCVLVNTNTTILTTAGTGTSTISNCYLSSGSASALSAGSGTTINCFTSTILSTNTNAVSGAGTFNYQGLAFGSNSQTINTTTQSQAGTLKGSTTTAPTAGMLGERLEASVGSVATTTATAKTIASVTLSAGIWDVSVLAFALPTGGTGFMQEMVVNLSTTTNTITGSLGIEIFQMDQATMNACSGAVPSVRVTISASTTYYAVVKNTYSSTTCPTNARISATRVG